MGSTAFEQTQQTSTTYVYEKTDSTPTTVAAIPSNHVRSTRCDNCKRHRTRYECP